MDDNELQEMIDRADQNGDGVISFEEFYNIMTKKTFAWKISELMLLKMHIVLYLTNIFKNYYVRNTIFRKFKTMLLLMT